MASTTNYKEEAQNDAHTMLEEFVDTMLAQVDNDGEISTDLFNDYPDGDSYHHERHVDKEYSLQEAAELLDQLEEYEETDSGLWSGLEPRKAISAQAAYTYGNAVYALWRDLVDDLDNDLDDLWENLEDSSEEVRVKATHCYVRLTVLFMNWDDLSDEGHNLMASVLEDIQHADYTSALAFCDWLEEHDQSGRQKQVRNIVNGEDK